MVEIVKSELSANADLGDAVTVCSELPQLGKDRVGCNDPPQRIRAMRERKAGGFEGLVVAAEVSLDSGRERVVQLREPRDRRGGSLLPRDLSQTFAQCFTRHAGRTRG